MGIIKQQYEKYLGFNPYKGFVPFIRKNKVECSMEFFYFPLYDILISDNCYNWNKLEDKLNIIYKRGHHSIFRIYLDYPTLETGVPQFLQNKIKMVKYSEFGGGISPDYHSKVLINVLLNFIKEFGKKYDGDKRIAFIEMGLIGHWGEWHCFPNDDLMPDEKTQISIIEAYNKFFIKTKILHRYPNSVLYQKYNIGFHDDSFCYLTLPSKEHHFVFLMNNYKLDKKWIKFPIGGEIRPEEQKALISGNKTTEDYMECLKATHASWLINDLAFNNKGDKELISKLSSLLGYDFYIDNIKLINNNITFKIYNKGIAPIYYSFNCYLIIGKKKVLLDYDIRNLLPNKSFKFNYKLSNDDLNNNIYFILENDENVIHLSNAYLEKELVLIYQK
ncbi:MAG: DUF4832 domain-containing protein [Ruminococcus sp.]|nr:DUF4832 domain-containing protein [Ruminococcus sp.]